VVKTIKLKYEKKTRSDRRTNKSNIEIPLTFDGSNKKVETGIS
jgi:imidazoleglycerol phosphate dehydratase HisB